MKSGVQGVGLNDSLLGYFQEIGFQPNLPSQSHTSQTHRSSKTVSKSIQYTSYTPNSKSSLKPNKTLEDQQLEWEDQFQGRWKSSSQHHNSPKIKDLQLYLRGGHSSNLDMYLKPDSTRNRGPMIERAQKREQMEQSVSDKDLSTCSLLQLSLASEFQSICESLQSYGFPRPGNIFEGGDQEARHTLDLIRAMLKQHRKDSEFRNKFNDQYHKIQSDKTAAKQKAELLKRECNQLENQNGGLRNKIETLHKQIRELNEKIKNHGDQNRHCSSKLDQKIKTLQFQLKKKDAQFEKMKEQLKRIIDQKTSSSGLERNHIEISSKFHTNPDYFCSTMVRMLKKQPESELMEDLKEGHEARFSQMWEENRNLKECLCLLQRQLSIMSKKIVNSILFYKSHSKIAANLSAEYKLDLAKLNKLSVEAIETSHYDQIKTKKVCSLFKESIVRFEAFINEFMNPLQILHFTERVRSVSLQLMAKFPEISGKVKDFKKVDAVLNCMAEWLASQQSEVSAKSSLNGFQKKTQQLASQKPSVPNQGSKRIHKLQNQNYMSVEFSSDKKLPKSSKFQEKIAPFHVNTKSMDTFESPEKPQRKIWKKAAPTGPSTFLGSKIKN